MSGRTRVARLGGRVLEVAAGGSLVLGLAGCGIGAPGGVAATPSALPQASVSGSIELAHRTIETALRSRELGLIVPTVPFRPAESSALTDVARAVYQVVLADDPGGGFVVIYEFPDPGAAYAAGVIQAAWLASGPGAIQYPAGTTHVLRQLGNTLLSFSYVASASPESRAAEVATVLESVGQGITSPR